MFGDIILHLFSLDIPWFVNLVAGNLLYLFGVFAAATIFVGDKKGMKAALLFFLFIWFNIFIELSYMEFFGWTLLAAEFLALVLITRFALLAFAESIPQLSKHFNLIYILHFYLLYMFYNLFMV